MRKRPEPASLKELQADHAEIKADAERLALALERLRRSVWEVLELARAHHALEAPAPIGDAFINLNASYNERAGDGYFLDWAADVLDGRVIPKRHGHKPRLETFHELRTRASVHNIHVHFQHRFEGTEYAIHDGAQKVAHANNDRDCMTQLRRLIRKKQR